MRKRWTVVVVVASIAGSIGGCDLLPSSHTARHPTPQYSPRLIPTAPDSPTRAEDFARIAEWERRNMLEAYDWVGRKDSRWDDPARKFISEHSLVRLWNVEELVPEGRRLLALGCDDPLVQYLVGLDLWWTDIESMEATFLFEQAVEGMKQVPYPRGIARFAVSALFRDHARTEKGSAQAPLGPLEVQWFREAMTDGSYQAGDEVVLAYHLRSGSGRSMFDRNQDAVYLAVEENPHLDRWVKLLMSGRRHFYNAWAARGSGYANEVTEEGWRVFREELALEREDLSEAWRLRPDRPEIAEAMTYLVHLQDFGEGEAVRMWFDRTVALQMDYEPAYFTMLTDLEPRWHGSHEGMLRFARECVDTGRYDTPVPAVLFEALDRIESDEYEAGHPGEGVYRRPEVYPLVQRVVDGYLGVVQEKRRRRQLNTRFVLAAHKAGRNEEACERILLMDGDLDAELTSWSTGGSRLLAGRICAEASAGDLLETAESRFQEGERDVPLDSFQEAASKESRPLAQAYLRHRIAALKLEAKLAHGDWVSFLPASGDLAGWEVIRGRWTFEDERSVLGETASKGMMIRSAARVGPGFEIRSEYELVNSTNDWYQGGVVVGDPRAHGRSWFSLRLMRNPMDEVAAIGTGFYAPHVQAEVPVPLKGQLHLVCQGGRVQAEVNSAVVARNYESPDGLATLADALVGFGGLPDDNVFSVRYRNVELRRLGTSPGVASP